MRLVVLGLVAGWFAVGTAQAAPILVRVDARPGSVGVGDPIDYVAVARLPADTVDAASVRIFADAGAFVQVGPSRTTHRVEGSTLVVTLVQHVACLDLACAPIRGRRHVVLPAARVAAELAGRVSTGRAVPVTVVVEPRVASAGAATPPYRQQTALPAASGRAGRLVTPLALVAAVSVLVAVLLAVIVAWPRSRREAHEAELARAVRLLRESATRSVPDRRRAADLLSRVTGSAGARSVAADASELAWSERSPKPEGTVALAERAQEAGR